MPVGGLELLVLLLDLLKQPDVFDGDHRLVGEGLEEGDLLIRERANFRTSDVYNADRNTFPKQRSGQYRSSTAGLLSRLRYGKFAVQLEGEILDMNGLLVDHRSAGR